MEEKKLRSYFHNRNTFSREELYDYFISEEGELNTGTFGWRIHDLKQKGILQEVRSGWYTLTIKQKYTPVPDKNILRIDKIIKNNFQQVSYCIWNIDWLSDFTMHQFSRNTFIVEIEKDLRSPLYFYLHNNGFRDVLDHIAGKELFISNAKNPIFILPLISRAPIQEITIDNRKSIPCPTIEKILVDIYEDDRLFYFVQGAELERIFENALTWYAVNLTTLSGYAKRRGKERSINNYLETKFPHLLSTDIE